MNKNAKGVAVQSTKPGSGLERLGARCKRWGVALVCILGVLFTNSAALADRPEPAGPANFAARQAAWEKHKQLVAESQFSGLAWRSVGPVVQGGRIVDIEAIPGEPFSFLVAYASGGLWKTTNNGHTFTPLFDDQPLTIMGDIDVAPSNPNVIWVGTGENNSSRSSYGGWGVFKSEDAGKTWRHMGLGESDRIGEIQIDPRDPNRVYVASLGKLYTPGGERGVYRTTDGGATWQQVMAGDDWTGAIALELDPSDPDTLYAATWERKRRPWNFEESGPGSAVWKSSDGGDTWARLEGGLPQGEAVGRIGLSVCASRPETIYVSIDHQGDLPEGDWDLGGSALTAKRLRGMTEEEFLAQDPDVIAGFIRGNDLDTTIEAEDLIERIENGDLTIEDLRKELDDANASLFDTDIRGVEVYRSDDSGQTWRRTHKEPLLQVVHTYGYYFGLIEVAPDDPDRVYIAGVPLLRSVDGGVSFQGINGRGVHVDYHSVWIDPSYPSRVVVGNDGGIDVSYDHGDTWRKVDAQAVGQFYTVTVDMAKPYNIYGGTQDNGTLKGSSRTRPGIGEWSFIGGGDGMYVQVDSRDNTVYYGYQFGFYTRRDPSGTRHEVRPRDALGEPALRYNWSTPIQLSSHNQDILYFGTNKLFRSMDQGETWKALSPDLSRSPERGDVPFACLTTVSESRLEFGLIWAATDDGLIYVTEDGGVQWTAVTDGIPRDRWVTRVAASRYVRDRAYLSLSGYRDDDISSYVYVTEDLGKTWRSLAAGLPAEPVNVIYEDPVNENLLYVGTDRGVYLSLDRGERWQGLAADLPKVPVHDLIVHPRDRELVAATHGRSVYVIDALPIQELTTEAQGAEVRVFPVEERTYARGWRGRRSRWFYDPQFDPKVKIPFWARTEGTAELQVLDDDDNVLRKLELVVRPGVSTLEWDLLLDPSLALPVEAARVAKEDDETREKGDEVDPKGSKARMPWAEAVRLENPVYVTPGKYKLRVSIGEASDETEFKVKEPSARDPRTKKEPKIRGEKDE